MQLQFHCGHSVAWISSRKELEECQMKLFRAALTAAAILILFTPALTVGSCAFAQGITTGVIIGTVSDQQGAVIPQATISAVDVASGANFKTQSDANGLFSLRNLPIGTYDLTIESGNFSPMQVKALRITAGITNDIGVRKMTVSNTATVTVESAAPVQPCAGDDVVRAGAAAGTSAQYQF
jgi:hypothetical protein